MKLMSELLENTTSSMLIENKESGGKDLYIEGVFAQGNVVNGNGRKYPISILAEAVRKLTNSHISKGRGYGELNHPPTATVNPDRYAHRVVSMVQEGNDFIGKSIVMNTPTGAIVRAMHESGGAIAVSTRGLGTIKKVNGLNEVQSDFRLITTDVVGNPSANRAWVKGLMEGVDWIYEDGLYKPQVIEEAKKMVEISYKHKKSEFREEDILKAFNKFMDKI